MVDRLRQRAGLPMPTVAIAPHEQPNAFATGRNPENAVVCVTEGILRPCRREELEGVIAHELAHIKNRDMLLQTFTATLAGAISNLAQFGAVLRRRATTTRAVIRSAGLADGDRGADRGDAHPVRDQPAARVQGGRGRRANQRAAAGARERADQARRVAHRIPMHVAPAAAPLAQVNPLALGGGVAKLFSTHPPTEERVARLEALAA